MNGYHIKIPAITMCQLQCINFEKVTAIHIASHLPGCGPGYGLVQRTN